VALEDTVRTARGLSLSFDDLVDELGQLPSQKTLFVETRIGLALRLRRDPSAQELWSEYERLFPQLAEQTTKAVAVALGGRRQADARYLEPASATASIADAIKHAIEEHPGRGKDVERTLEARTERERIEELSGQREEPYPWGTQPKKRKRKR
jgi:hypothetical protein